MGVHLPHAARRPHRLATVPGGVHLVGAYTQYAKPHPRVRTFLSAVYRHVTAEDPPEDDDELLPTNGGGGRKADKGGGHRALRPSPWRSNTPK
jgi:hypothetical protein